MKETIKDLENLNDQFERPFTAIENAIAFLNNKSKYEKLCIALEERYGYAYVHKLLDKSNAEVIQVRELMARLRSEFFGGSKVTLRQRINDMINCLNTPGINPNVKELKHLLIELRDREDIE